MLSEQVVVTSSAESFIDCAELLAGIALVGSVCAEDDALELCDVLGIGPPILSAVIECVDDGVVLSVLFLTLCVSAG